MNFQVPQFIEIEDKIIGPFSFRQFLYLATGTGLAYLFYNLSFIPLFIRLIPVLLAFGSGLALTFYKVNNRPLIHTVEAAFWYLVRGRLYLWRKDEQKQLATPTAATLAPSLGIKSIAGSKLKDLSWSLDVNEKIK
ncbi:MAG: PrgI family protein [Candidatus Vogelbacteria bacterium]|nr:PrgI family protein [Candidatus Vogelbacteria bacterium]